MQRTQDTFRFTSEAGRFLARIRKQAGLTQSELAELMGRGRNFQSRIARLEQGRIRFPSLALIADYLRACRASFDDLNDLLKPYTSQPVVAEKLGRERVQQVLANLPREDAVRLNRYDIKTSVARRAGREPPLDSDERVMRVRKQAAAWLLRHKLDAWLNQVIKELGIHPAMLSRKLVYDFGHQVWRILTQYRVRPGMKRRTNRRRKPLEQRLGEARQKAAESGVLSESVIADVEAAVRVMFDSFERSGQLDYLPGPAEAAEVPKPRPIRGPRPWPASTTAPGSTESNTDRRFLSIVNGEVARQMEREKLPAELAQKYALWLSRLEAIALDTAPDSDERHKRTQELVRTTGNPALSGHIAEVYYAAFERWRSRIFREPKTPAE
ncbi:MAG: helix-turn-helix transcriptional regulator [candidate division WOR-3 bacterium]